MKAILIAATAMAMTAPAFAEEQPVALKATPGMETVQGNCGSCHSLDYIKMNSPFLNPAGWDAEVTKMIKTFGAPITDEDAKVIRDYLNKNYGG